MKKLISATLATLLTLSMLTACGSSGAPQSSSGQTPSSTDSDDSFGEYVELLMYSSGSSGPDTEKAMKHFNELLKEKANTTIKVTCLGWDNYENQYNLILTSGEKADLMYVNPNLYSRYASTGAFTDLTDLFPEYMPETYALFSEDELQQARVDGHLYVIPSYEVNYNQNGIFYRQDLGEKYGVDKIDSMESLEAYMDAVAKNETNVRPIDGNPEQALFQLFKSYYGFESIAGSNTSIVMVRGYDDIEDIVAYPFTEEYVEWVHRMKDWADRGFWSTNALSSTIDPWSSIQVGTSAITQANADGAKNMMRTMGEKLPNAVCDYWSLANLTGYSYADPVMQNGYVVPASSQNAERALRVLELIKTDQELFDAWMYGIEGYHFDLNESGQLVRPAAGQDPAKVNTHSMSGAQYAMRVKGLMREDAGVWVGYQPLLNQLNSMSVPNKFGAVVLDYTNVQAELAAVNQVVQQYGMPINVGIVDDVDAAVEEYRAQLESAGIDRLVEAVKAQMLAYYEANGIT